VSNEDDAREANLKGIGNKKLHALRIHTRLNIFLVTPQLNFQLHLS